MKTLFIIRHAKSDRSIDGLADIDRSLNRRGYGDAHAIGKSLKEKGLIPEVFVSSPAIRALSTGLIIAEEMFFPKAEIRIEPKLYETNSVEYINVLKTIDPKVQSAAIFGHNPTVSDLCTQWARKLIDMPTCAVVQFKVNSDNWNNLSVENVEFIEMIFPKMI